jgi:hypothetical protein
MEPGESGTTPTTIPYVGIYFKLRDPLAGVVTA